MKTLPILLCCAVSVLALLARGADAPFPATAGPAIAAPRTPDGFTIVNGRVFFIRNGQMMPLDREVTLRISPSGTITAFSGQEYAIPQGQVLTLVAGVAALPAHSEAVASQIGSGAAAAGGTVAGSGSAAAAASGTAGVSDASGASATSGTSGGASDSGLYTNGGGSGFLPFDLFGPTAVIPGAQQPLLGPNNGIAGGIVNPATGRRPNGAPAINNATGTTANGTAPTNGSAGTPAQTPAAVLNQQAANGQQIPPNGNNATGAANPQTVGGQQTAPGTNAPFGNPNLGTTGAGQAGAQQTTNPNGTGNTTNTTGSAGARTGGTTGGTTGGATGGTTGGAAGGGAGGGRGR